jgi:hypothetical protein
LPLHPLLLLLLPLCWCMDEALCCISYTVLCRTLLLMLMLLLLLLLLRLRLRLFRQRLRHSMRLQPAYHPQGVCTPAPHSRPGHLSPHLPEPKGPAAADCQVMQHYAA